MNLVAKASPLSMTSSFCMFVADHISIFSVMASVLAVREIAASCDKDFCKKLDKALKIIESALHVYAEAELAFSFNGGKDSTVVLHLLRAVFEKASRSGSIKTLASMKHVYFQTNDEFPEILGFIEECNKL